MQPRASAVADQILIGGIDHSLTHCLEENEARKLSPHHTLAEGETRALINGPQVKMIKTQTVCWRCWRTYGGKGGDCALLVQPL